MLQIIIKILLFIIYPVISYFFIKQSFSAMVVGLCLSIFTLFIIVLIEKKQKLQTAVLDISAASDERILDFVNYNLFQKIVLPKFVIKDIEKLSKDNSNKTLDNNIKKLKENKKITLSYKDYIGMSNCDLKILRLAKDLKAKIITTNFNLNKIAAIQSIKVIDLNDLYECLKPIILPGYNISIMLAKEGKDRNQAIGFLDDGTTVVAENGRAFIGKKVNLVITSVLQTSANKMLFGKISQENIESAIKK